MCYSQLSMLNNILNDKQILILNDYFINLTPNTIDKITASKISNALNVDFDTARSVLIKCKNEGILTSYFGIRCPVCNALIKKVFDLDIEFDLPTSCYICNQEIEITDEEIELIFALEKNKIPFSNGRHSHKDDSTNDITNVARVNMLKSYTESGKYDLNKTLYKPSEKEYQELEILYNIVINSDSNKEKGASLEMLTIKLFSLCPIFKANSIRTKLNQIDCYVRNKLFIPCGLFSKIGGCYVIECKNENKKAKSGYISKLHSFILETDGKGNNIKLGIIVSKMKPPRTFKGHSIKYYLSHQKFIIHISCDEIKKIIDDRGNLLDLIENKVDAVLLDIEADYQKAGFYA